jgi:hypothetical protein
MKRSKFAGQTLGLGRVAGEVEEVSEQKVGRLVLAASIALGTEGRIDFMYGIERFVFACGRLAT